MLRSLVLRDSTNRQNIVRTATAAREIGCPSRPQEIGIDEAVLHDSFVYAKETRARYTLLQLVSDLGLMEKLSGRVAARIGEI